MIASVGGVVWWIGAGAGGGGGLKERLREKRADSSSWVAAMVAVPVRGGSVAVQYVFGC